MKPLWIELVDSGVANRFSFKDYELIELNYRLVDYPDLYYNILNHELKHKEGNHKLFDFIHDLKNRTPGLHKFMFKNPSTWIQILPIYKSKSRNQIVYDYSSIVQWIFFILTFMITFLILRWLL